MRILSIASAAVMLLTISPASADSEADQLRQALQSAILQSRQAEDERAGLQASLAKAQQDAAREKAAAAAQLRTAKAEAKKLEKEHRDTVNQFNERLKERDDALEKWKSAYEEAATVARSKDAERAKFQADSIAFKASTKSCGEKNKALVKTGQEILLRYKQVTIGDIIDGHEPMFGLKRTDIESKIQDFGDKLSDQKVNP